MDKYKTQEGRPKAPSTKDGDPVYDLSTPRLDRFIRQARKHVRFPRYYKRALNW